MIVGSRVPGLCLEVGRANLGLTLGLLTRQRLTAIKKEDWAGFPLVAKSWGLSLGTNDNGKWVLGVQSVSHLPNPNRTLAVATAKALAGLGLEAEPNDSGITCGLSSRQRLACAASDSQFEIDQVAKAWPGFDFFNANISSVSLTNTGQDNAKSAP